MSTPAHVFTLADARAWNGHSPLQLAVLGDPVAHSASPPMHMAALKACGLTQVYGRLHIRPEELAEAIALLKFNNFIGVNLTIPHKTAVLPLLDVIHPHAKLMGAVNTLAFDEGSLTGFNTDGTGLVRAIAQDFDASLGNLRVLILGAGGGAGRAIALQCALEGCRQIVLVNRTLDKVEALAAEIRQLIPSEKPAPQVFAVSLTDPNLADYVAATDLILQCSSLGMNPEDPSPLNRSLLRRDHCVYDTIYSSRTQLIRDAEGVGARTANGLSMLLHQGALAFEIWFQREAPVDLMQAALLQYRAAK